MKCDKTDCNNFRENIIEKCIYSLEIVDDCIKNNYKYYKPLTTQYNMYNKDNNQSDTQNKIDTFSENFNNFLKEKNKKYGDSVLNPVKIFSTDDPGTAEICIRINDKLGRIKQTTDNKTDLRKNDTIDLIGYLHLLCIQNDWLDFTEFLD